MKGADTLLEFSVKNQIIKRLENDFIPVAGSRNYLTAKFNFETDEWTGIITAIFTNDCTAKRALLDSNNECLVPWEVLTQPGTLWVSVYCGDLITANRAEVRLNVSGYIDADETLPPPSPSEYQQLVKLASETRDIAQSVRDDADAGKFDGPPGDDGKAATIKVGKVTTGEPGTPAKVVNSGDENAAVLDFIIPRGEDGGVVDYKIGEGLKVVNGDTLAVDTVNSVEEDNTKPITSAAVYTTVGNIDAYLKTI